MGNFQSKITSKDKALLELKVQRDKLKQYEKRITKVIDKELEICKQQLKLKNHHAARLCLLKKAYQQQLLTRVGDQLLQIEQLSSTLEYKMVELEIMNKLKMGNDCLQLLNKEMDIDKIQSIMDDTKEAIEYQFEIQTIIENSLSDKDQQDILLELDQLIQMENKIDLNMPNVPTQDPVNVISDPTSVKQPKLNRPNQLKTPIKSELPA